MRAPYDEWFGPDAFDATYGYDEAALAEIRAPEEPSGFGEFWTGLHAQADGVATDPLVTEVGAVRGHRIHTVTFSSLGGVRLGGWVTFPEAGPAERAVVGGGGAGGGAPGGGGLVGGRSHPRRP
jgi:cephalosporin-C deacetylase